MSIKRNGSQPSMKGPAETFTGNVRIDPLFQAPGTTPFGGASVSFEPGARSACHSTARTSSGWRRSLMNNTSMKQSNGPEQAADGGGETRYEHHF